MQRFGQIGRLHSSLTACSIMHENLSNSPLSRVLVYGTLKRGEPNHSVISNKDNGHAKFMGLGKTLLKYPLVIATKYNIPFMLGKPGVGHQIVGEIYDVDSKMMKKLDELEEHPEFYVRNEEDVILASENEIINGESFENVGTPTKAWIYILPKFRESLLDQPMYSSYSNNDNHGLKYHESKEEFAKPEDLL